jgi:hypothetical protein
MCDSGVEEKKVRVFKVFRPDTGNTNHCVYRDWETLRDVEFDGAEIGDRIIIELGEMTQDQLSKLPDFEGW